MLFSSWLLIPFIETTLQDVRLQLAREEAAQAAISELLQHKTSPLTFLMAGFELEDSQYVIFISISL